MTTRQLFTPEVTRTQKNQRWGCRAAARRRKCEVFPLRSSRRVIRSSVRRLYFERRDSFNESNGPEENRVSLIDRRIFLYYLCIRRIPQFFAVRIWKSEFVEKRPELTAVDSCVAYSYFTIDQNLIIWNFKPNKWKYDNVKTRNNFSVCALRPPPGAEMGSVVLSQFVSFREFLLCGASLHPVWPLLQRKSSLRFFFPCRCSISVRLPEGAGHRTARNAQAYLKERRARCTHQHTPQLLCLLRFPR